MSDYVIYVIDGTGKTDDIEYRASFENSFCRQIFKNARGVKQYVRGPSAEGSMTTAKAITCARFIADNAKGRRIYLSGYSRGAAAVVIAARMLKTFTDASVDGLFLFDPVDMRMFDPIEMITPALVDKIVSSESVPDNVRKVFIVRRALDAPQMGRYDYAFYQSWRSKHADANFVERSYGFLKTTVGKGSHNPDRTSWGWTATGVDNASKTAKFEISPPVPCSHGALGGVGWDLPDGSDFFAQCKVADFMNPFLHKEMGVSIRSFMPRSKL